MYKYINKIYRWTPYSGLIITLIIIALIIAPVASNQLAPLNDYPFHLARIVILSDLNNPFYSQFYKLGSFLLPNMAMDIVAVPLAHFVGAETASRVFVMLSLISMLMGTMLLHMAAHKRFSPWPLLAVTLLFNGIFRFGFLNYIFGMGVAFLFSGIWVWMKPTNFRIFYALIASIILIFLHFAAFSIFAVTVGSIEIYAAVVLYKNAGIKQALLQLIKSASPFLMTIALFIFFSPTAEVESKGLSYPNYLGAKPLGALYSLLTGIKWLDILSLSCITIFPCILFIKKRLQISRPLLLAMLMMMLAFIVLPSSLLGSSFVFVRLGPAIALLWITSTDIQSTDVRLNNAVSGLALVLAILISTTISAQWHDFNNKTSEIIRVFEKTEKGATIFSATTQPFTRLITDSHERRAAWTPPLKHIASYAVLYGPRFVPMTFVDPTKQPLNVTDKYQLIKEFQGDNPRKTFTGLELENYLLEIKNHLTSGDWPRLDNVYLFVMGFDRIKDSFDSSKLEGWAHIVELNKDNILIKLD